MRVFLGFIPSKESNTHGDNHLPTFFIEFRVQLASVDGLFYLMGNLGQFMIYDFELINIR